MAKATLRNFDERRGALGKRVTDGVDRKVVLKQQGGQDWLGNAIGNHERNEFDAKLVVHETDLADCRIALGRQRDALEAAAAAHYETLDQLRCVAEREREELKTAS